MGYDEFGSLQNLSGGASKGHLGAGIISGLGEAIASNARKNILKRQAADETLQRQLHMAGVNAHIRAQEREHAHDIRKREALHGAAVKVATAEEMSRVALEKERGRRGIFEEERISSASDKARAARMKELEKERPKLAAEEGPFEGPAGERYDYSGPSIGATVTHTDTTSDIQGRRDVMMQAMTGSPEPKDTRLQK